MFGSMKLLFCSLAVCFSTVLYAQIPKDANTIIVKGVTFKEAVNRLLEIGFNIAQTDSIYQTIKTEPTATKVNGEVLLTLYTRIKDSNAYIKGDFTIALTKDFGVMQVRNAGTNISPLKHAFNSMNNAAISFNKPVEYIKQ
jgi:hypothetical protein